MGLSFITVFSIIVSSMLVYSAPLIFTALGGVFSERAGIVNVGLEGIMVVGAFVATIFNLYMAPSFGKATPWLGLIVAGLVGCLFSFLHALATVNLRADHIVSGTVINLMAPGITIFLTRMLFQQKGQTEMITQIFGKTTFPLLSKIPVIGPIFFTNTSAPAYLAILTSFVCYFILFKTTFGLRLRSVGEHPQAADTLGINVYRMRYAGVLLSGFFGGIGGAVVAQSITLNFSHATIIGQGFIAMAAMIFGKWNPIGAMMSALLFGLAQSLSVIGNYIPVIKDVPSVWLSIAPYIITIVVLVGFIGKSEGPAANGTTYIKSK